MSTTLGITRVGQVNINVYDVQRAVDFYRDVLGLRFLFQIPDSAFFDCGGLRLVLGKAERAEFDHLASILYYQVPDIHAAHASLKAAGVATVDDPHLVARMPDHELWMFFFHDPEGNLLALMSEVR